MAPEGAQGWRRWAVVLGAHSAGSGDGIPPATAWIRHIRSPHAAARDHVAWLRAPASDHVHQRPLQRLPREYRQGPGEEG